MLRSNSVRSINDGDRRRSSARGSVVTGGTGLGREDSRASLAAAAAATALSRSNSMTSIHSTADPRTIRRSSSVLSTSGGGFATPGAPARPASQHGYRSMPRSASAMGHLSTPRQNGVQQNNLRGRIAGGAASLAAQNMRTPRTATNSTSAGGFSTGSGARRITTTTTTSRTPSRSAPVGSSNSGADPARPRSRTPSIRSFRSDLESIAESGDRAAMPSIKSALKATPPTILEPMRAGGAPASAATSSSSGGINGSPDGPESAYGPDGRRRTRVSFSNAEHDAGLPTEPPVIENSADPAPIVDGDRSASVSSASSHNSVYSDAEEAFATQAYGPKQPQQPQQPQQSQQSQQPKRPMTRKEIVNRARLAAAASAAPAAAATGGIRPTATAPRQFTSPQPQQHRMTDVLRLEEAAREKALIQLGISSPAATAPATAGGDESDSDSSFRRRRRQRATESKGFRVSLRPEADAAPSSNNANFTVPSTPSSNSRRMRMSMRAEPEAAEEPRRTSSLTRSVSQSSFVRAMSLTRDDKQQRNRGRLSLRPSRSSLRQADEDSRPAAATGFKRMSMRGESVPPAQTDSTPRSLGMATLRGGNNGGRTSGFASSGLGHSTRLMDSDSEPDVLDTLGDGPPAKPPGRRGLFSGFRKKKGADGRSFSMTNASTPTGAAVTAGPSLRGASLGGLGATGTHGLATGGLPTYEETEEHLYRSSSPEPVGNHPLLVSKRTGKVKRFQKLRRFLGIQD